MRACPGPSISTRQSRQEPKASSESVAQSFGICVPFSLAARMMEVPPGTRNSCPSMTTRTVSAAVEGLVP
jgi:hypothetical protein